MVMVVLVAGELINRVQAVPESQDRDMMVVRDQLPLIIVIQPAAVGVRLKPVKMAELIYVAEMVVRE